MVAEVIELLGDVARRVDVVVELWKPLTCFLETLVRTANFKMHAKPTPV